MRRNVSAVSEFLPPSRTDRFRSVGLVLVLLALFAGVSAVVDQIDDDPVTVIAAVESEASESGSNAGPIEGEFLVSGSSTVYPIVLEQAEAFSAANTGVAISVEGPGSGDGV